MIDTLDFLRLAARQCRTFARYHQGDAAAGLLRLAIEMEERAEGLEPRLGGRARAVEQDWHSPG